MISRADLRHPPASTPSDLVGAKPIASSAGRTKKPYTRKRVYGFSVYP